MLKALRGPATPLRETDSAMPNCDRFYLNGVWEDAADARRMPIINPATEAAVGEVALGDAHHVARAVAAARAAFPSFARTTPAERLELLGAVQASYKKHFAAMGEAICTEMGAPLGFLASTAQAGSGLAHFKCTAQALRDFPFERRQGNSLILREPVGVCALITPWNWPANQMACKIAPALAAGCTMVLKPSELAPLSAQLMATILHEAGVPAGVFNLVHGDGAGVGAPLAAHPEVDMVSFTGSTRAGVQVMKLAADTVKKVALELGGKSANILLDDASLPAAVAHGVQTLMTNSGQNCNAPSRMLVPAHRLAEAEALAVAALAGIVPGDPRAPETRLGPVANGAQFARVQALIEAGVAEGGRLLAGGPGRPTGLAQGYFVQPTLFSGVSPQMQIAREEIFGPVLCLIPYADEAEAVQIANDSVYGLSGYVYSADPARSLALARQLRTGNVHLNGAPVDLAAPFGGYRQSGLGREWGVYGLEEFLETKAILGAPSA